MRRSIAPIVFFVFMLCCSGSSSSPGSEAKVISEKRYLLYIPGGIDPSMRYPLILALHPAADAKCMIEAWKAVAEKYRWLILASRESRNGADMYRDSRNLNDLVLEIAEDYPVDRTKIIATGFSGGGQASHFLSMHYPELFRAIVVNTCRIHEAFSSNRGLDYPRNKIAVFLASRTDFRYSEMKADRRFLESMGWRTQWIEFQGGHRIAPEKAYLKAAEWLDSQL
jgi:predicted esterase